MRALIEHQENEERLEETNDAHSLHRTLCITNPTLPGEGYSCTDPDGEM